MNRNVIRTAVAALTLSAAGFAVLVEDEEFAPVATIPTKNDRPTNCFGMTWRPDGTPVQIGDKCTPVEGIKRGLAHIDKDESGLKRCVTAPLAQAEYDILVNFSYQYGVGTACTSTMVKQANLGNYAAACEGYLLYKKSGGYDCSTLINGKRNRRCWGVWLRNIERRNSCLAAGA